MTGSEGTDWLTGTLEWVPYDQVLSKTNLGRWDHTLLNGLEDKPFFFSAKFVGTGISFGYVGGG